MSAIVLFMAPSWIVAIFFPTDLTFILVFCCVIFGTLRLIAGYAIWAKKRGGVLFGMGLSVATLIISPILIFYVIKPPLAGMLLALLLDISLALVVLASLSYTRFCTHRKLIKV